MPALAKPRKKTAPLAQHLSTLEVGRMLGLAVRSVQLMVDRGELKAWKTAGGHRRICRESVERWRSNSSKNTGNKASKHQSQGMAVTQGQTRAVKVLYIEDSTHFQNMVALLLGQQFPALELRTAGDSISGLAIVGQMQPDILIVDILLPGIDGAALVSSLRMHPQFRAIQAIVVTSMSPQQREPYALALHDLPVIYKPHLVTELPNALRYCLGELQMHA